MQTSEMQQTLVRLITQRLEQDKEALENMFSQRSGDIPTRYAVVDNLLPAELAKNIYRSFPQKNQMRQLSSFRERKYTYKQLDQTPQLLKDITFAIQSPEVVSLVETITRIPGQQPDSSLYAGGISLMVKGNFLNPHIDNSHDFDRRRYRTLNLLYYVTPDWKVEYGGNLELWDENVRTGLTIPSLFNRLVLMETNRKSWHSVSPVIYDGQRCTVSNYYFSEICPEKEDYFNVTSFSGRPGQVFRRLIARVDSLARNSLRSFFRKGIGKRDLYTPNQQGRP